MTLNLTACTPCWWKPPAWEAQAPDALFSLPQPAPPPSQPLSSPLAPNLLLGSQGGEGVLTVVAPRVRKDHLPLASVAHSSVPMSIYRGRK